MAKITYKARNLSGEIVEGYLRARDESDARIRLSEKGLELLSVEAPSSPPAAEPSLEEEAPLEFESRARSPQGAFGGLLRPVSTRDLRSMTAQLALLLDTGTPLAQSLQALAEQTTEGNLGEVLEDVYQTINAGSTLTQALSQHPRVFGPFFISAVKAGEASGQLTEVFKRLEVDMGKREELLSRLRAALIYPAILMTLATGAVIFLVSFVLPRFVVVFQNSGTQLPLPTRILLGLTNFSHDYWYLVLLAVIVPVVGAWLFVTSAFGRPLWHRLLLVLPVVGPLVNTVQSSTFLRILGTLISSGVPLVESLDVVAEACGNICYKGATQKIKKGVLQGEGFSSSVSRSGLFSPTVKQMIATGERSGSLDIVTDKMADYLDDMAQNQLRKLSALFEPLVIIIMGIIIGFIAISLMLPLFRLSSAMS